LIREIEGLNTVLTEISHTDTRPDTQEAQRFRVEALIARGGQGPVYRAFDEQLGRDVALKVLGGEDLHALTLRIDGVVEVFDVRLVSIDRVYCDVIVMPYLTGGTLADRLKKADQRRIEPREAAALVSRLAHTVQRIHAHGRVHLDLKPSNVMFDFKDDARGKPVLVDFGISATREKLEKGKPSLAGTPAYMAPEQIDGRPLGPKTDVWQLGVILYEAICGRLPFTGDGVHELCNAIRTRELWPFADGLADAELEAICRSCVKKDPELRPTAGELAKQLDNWLAPVEPGLTPRKRLAFAGIVLIVLAVLAATSKLLREIPPNIAPGPSVAPIAPANVPTEPVLATQWPALVKQGERINLKLDENSDPPTTNCQVEVGGALQINGAATVAWPPGTGIVSRGRLEISGDADTGDLIFRSANSSKPWNGIRLWGRGADGSRLSHVTIEGGRGALTQYPHDPWITARAGRW
jgi:serine/threonine protein kinase